VHEAEAEAGEDEAVGVLDRLGEADGLLAARDALGEGARLAGREGEDARQPSAIRSNSS